jgi:hypothetical protein
METKNYYRNLRRNKLIFGGLVIVAGIVLFGLNFGFIPQAWKPILFSWQMLLVLGGIVVLFHAKFFRGIILLLAGGFFLIPDFYRAYPEYFGWASENFVQIYWPLLLIAGGVMLIIYWLLPNKYRCSHRSHYFYGGKRHFDYHYSYDDAGHTCDSEDSGEGKESDSDARKSKNRKGTSGVLNKDVIFAGSDEIFLDEVFNGGSLNAVFGGINLDLRRTTLPEGETVLDINAVFGGVNLYVPSTWLVDVRTDAIAGGFTDSRPPNTPNMDLTRKLIITGSFVFGGGEMR